ncbi:MAG: hypothetical protein KJ018_10390, partial [Burkholderiales bacterium]|nr:hypothetical protein [Burkholderiales bacterium]
MQRLALLAVGGLFAACAQGATIDVTTLADAGAGSLRDAVQQANASPGPDTITFSVAGTITLTSGQIAINDALTITGPGAASLTIDGNLASRIFSIFENVADSCATPGSDFPVSIAGLTLANARRLADSSGGAIFSEKSLALHDVTIRDSRAKNGGGAVVLFLYPNQTLTITASRFVGNVATPLSAVTGSTNFGGGLHVAHRCGGAETAPATVTIQDTTFSGNSVQPALLSGRGGGLSFLGAFDVTLARSRIVDNAVVVPASPQPGTSFRGGGVFARTRTLTIVDSEIAENAAVEHAGLLLFNDVAALQTPQGAMTVDIVGTTVADNVASGNVGGMSLFGNVAAAVRNATVVGNVAAPALAGGIQVSTGPTSPPGASNALVPTLSIESSVLWNPQDGGADVRVPQSAVPTFTLSASTSAIGRICSTPDCGSVTLVGSGNLLGMDPLLGALASNGG